MKKNILLPTDFSDNAWSAAVYAFNLYADQDVKFYFLNSIAISHGESRTFITSRYVDTMRKQAKSRLEDLQVRAESLKLNPNHSFEILLSTEDLSDTIKNSIKLYSIDLVIMGTKGATGFDRFFIGSNTVKTIQNIKDCPILMVPFDYEFNAPKHIAFSTDFKRKFEEKEIKALLDFADLYQAHIYVLHIDEKEKLDAKQNENVATLQTYLENHQYTFHWMQDYIKKSEVINNFIDDLKIEVLAMVNYKHSIIENIVKEPIIKKIGYHPTVPFLVIPE